ncbi:MAG: hypothetical protein LBF25_02715 [Puniceicoccales bacterium]|nr:hypothetical protein [Puniceicoccales bacterium]
MATDPITQNKNSSADTFSSKPSEHASAEANASNSKDSKKGNNPSNPASEPSLTIVNPSNKGESGNNSKERLNFLQRWWRGLRSDSAKEKVNKKEAEAEAKAKKETDELEEKLRKDMGTSSSKSTHENVGSKSGSDSEDEFDAWFDKCSDPSIKLMIIILRSHKKALDKSEEEYKQWGISKKVNDEMVSEQKRAADKAAELGRKLETPRSVAGVVKFACFGVATASAVIAVAAFAPTVTATIASIKAAGGIAAGVAAAFTKGSTVMVALKASGSVGVACSSLSGLSSLGTQVLPSMINSGTKKEMDLNQAKVNELGGRINLWGQKTSMCAQRMSEEFQMASNLNSMMQSILQYKKDMLSALTR